MEQQLRLLKEEITKIRATGGKKIRFPQSLWLKIHQASKDIPLKDLCLHLRIDLNNAKRRMKEVLSASKKPNDEQKLNFIQLPSICSPILEITTPNGAVIKVYSA